MIEQNILSIRERMNQAALAAGRDPREILLCAATKMNDTERVRRAILGGVDCCGENKVQELVQKQKENAYEGAPVHFIGHLQTNKVKQVVGKVDLIQSVDRLALLECIEKEAARQGICQDILFEINIASEESKSGFTVQEVYALVPQMDRFPHCKLKGLMVIPPVSDKKGANRKFFEEIRTIAVDITSKKSHNISMDILSMGMTDDFEDAIACGSTMIRVGTAIFGARYYK